jgi:hypothetical protein
MSPNIFGCSDLNLYEAFTRKANRSPPDTHRRSNYQAEVRKQTGILARSQLFEGLQKGQPSIRLGGLQSSHPTNHRELSNRAAKVGDAQVSVVSIYFYTGMPGQLHPGFLSDSAICQRTTKAMS